MKIRKHFRTRTSTIDYIITDFSLNRVIDKKTYFKYCANARMEQLNKQYDEKIDNILNFIILNCEYNNLPLKSMSRIILSLSKVTNALSKGIISLLEE